LLPVQNHRSRESVETVVIGAGQAGLAASYCLSARGREHLVLERGRVGETWRSQRWDGFYLNTPNWTHQLPGDRYAGPEPHAFASLREIIARLEEYARRFRSPVREGVEVTRVSRNGNSFHVESHGSIIAADNVIVAAGAYQRPTPTAFIRSLPPGVTTLHTSEYKRPSQLPPGAVLVIGSGQSGCQIAEELLAADREVYLSVSKCPWVPRRYRGHDFMHWSIETGRADVTVDALRSPAARLECNPPVSGNDGGHDCHPLWLARRGAALLGRVEAIDGSKIRLGSGLEESIASGEAFVAQFKRAVDELVNAKKLDVPDPEPEEKREREPLPSIDTLDLRDAGVTSVIRANGFRPDHSWIEGLERDEQEWPLHRRGITALPGLYFVGLHFLHTRKSSLFLGVGEDAEHVVEHLAERSARVK